MSLPLGKIYTCAVGTLTLCYATSVYPILFSYQCLFRTDQRCSSEASGFAAFPKTWSGLCTGPRSRTWRWSATKQVMQTGGQRKQSPYRIWLHEVGPFLVASTLWDRFAAVARRSPQHSPDFLRACSHINILPPICLSYMLPQWSPAFVFDDSTLSSQLISYPRKQSLHSFLLNASSVQLWNCNELKNVAWSSRDSN